jgi:hypothetical protein
VNALAVDLKALLVADSSAEVVDGASSPNADWAIFIGALPDKPDRAIRITDSGGPDPEYLMDDTTVQRNRAQIFVRSRTYTDGFAKAKALMGVLAPTGDFTQGGSSYWNVVESGSITYLGQDENRRCQFSANVIATRS